VPLLEPDEPPAYRLERPEGQSPFFLTCDHAGARVPRKLQSLGVSFEDMQRHIAWDIGAGAVTLKLAAALDAFAILQTYSRLVIDCNRLPGVPTSIVRISEATPIPGNELVTLEDAAAREREIFRPYHDRIHTELDARQRQSRFQYTVSRRRFTGPLDHGTRAFCTTGTHVWRWSCCASCEQSQSWSSETTSPTLSAKAWTTRFRSTARNEACCMSESSCARI
jgi:predicted N-formylglutamate amidohydrolase